MLVQPVQSTVKCTGQRHGRPTLTPPRGGRQRAQPCTPAWFQGMQAQRMLALSDTCMSHTQDEAVCGLASASFVASTHEHQVEEARQRFSLGLGAYRQRSRHWRVTRFPLKRQHLRCGVGSRPSAIARSMAVLLSLRWLCTPPVLPLLLITCEPQQRRGPMGLLRNRAAARRCPQPRGALAGCHRAGGRHASRRRRRPPGTRPPWGQHAGSRGHSQGASSAAKIVRLASAISAAASSGAAVGAAVAP